MTKNVVFISKQRLVGATNGSSAYLLDLARAVRDAGMVPHLLQPSPSVTGRMPILRSKPEMRVFATHKVRGVVKVGDTIVAISPRVYWALAQTALGKIARRLGVTAGWAQDKPMPYSIATPWTGADHAWLRRHSRGIADAAIADYMFCTAGFADLPDPQVPTAIVMHDLFHAREAKDEAGRNRDSVSLIGRDEEIAALARADAVIAIQAAEARFVRENVADTLTILAPMAAHPVEHPLPGTGPTLLFVGSNTAPNVVGLQWLFADVWPHVLAQWPDARLDIAGTVGRAFPHGGPQGVRFLGLVDDLARCYVDAEIIVSPLTFGSGLKIKLIEALAYGKASVVTSITLQGAEAECDGAVALADDPRDFADHIVRLHRDPAARADLAARALEAANRHFSPRACYGAFTDWLRTAAQ